MEIRMDYFPFWLRYAEEWEKFNMTAEQVGTLVLSAAAYMRDGTEPDFSRDTLCMIVWTYMQKDLNTAHERYAKAVESGRRGGRKPASKAKCEDPLHSEAEETSKGGKGSAKGSKGSPKGSKGSAKGEEPLSKTESESKTKTKTLTKSISQTKTTTVSESTPEPTAAPKSGAAEPVEAQSYGTHGWIKLTPEEYAALLRQMGKKHLDHYIRCTDAYIQRSKNALGYSDWQNLILRFYQEKMYHSTLP